eukprot:GFUD01017013.1.p1 GENE.GFUD01017013.1~~GFUD01017013.1.p1  ORF type:complete len:187 (-),score=60.65 GFUD01017013.1:32-592(-)
MPKDEKVPKTVLDKIVAVVKTQNTPGGSSRQAISKGYKEKFGEVAPNALKGALKKGVDSKILVQNGQKFWVEGHAPPPPTAEETVDIVDVEEGSGEAAGSGSKCTMSYIGTLKEGGEKFDSASKFTFTIGAGEVIKGWDIGVKGMKVGGKRLLTVPAKLGYGKRGSPPEIPGDAALCFEVKLVGLK